MKKYNSFLGAFFSGDNGQGGYNAAYGKSALAKLYTGSLPPEQQQEAVAGLARVDPDAAYKFQQTQQAAQQESLKRKAMLIANAPPAQRGQLYASVLPEIRKDWADAPEQYTPELDSMVTTWAQTVGGAGNKGKYTGAPIIVQTENGPKYARYSDSGIELTQFAPDDRFTMNVDAEGNVRGYNTRRNVLTPTADGSQAQTNQPMPPPSGNATQEYAVGIAEQFRENMGREPTPQELAEMNRVITTGRGEFSFSSHPPAQSVRSAVAPARVAVKGPEAPKGTYRPATADEVRSAGLPEGSSAQIGPDGKLEVINKPTPATSKQDTADAVKLYAQIPALKRRAMRVAEASKKLGVMGVDGGPIDQYALRFTEGGSELESSVGQLRASLLPLVRVPGVGSQSDLEARMDSLQYPDASQPPAVRQRNIEELSLFINDLEKALANVAKGQQAQPAQQGQPVRIRGAEDYNRLPSGARYIDPNGTLRVKK